MKLFQQVGGLKPGRSLFDLSYSKLFDCYSGALIPVMCDEVVPGDFFDISNECIVRLQPLVAPVLHEINVSVHYFFVPYRILWPNWESFITGQESGADDPNPLPRWKPDLEGGPAKGSLWDYFGFPLVNLTGMDAPLIFPLWAYYLIWNEYYRDQTQDAPISIATVYTGDGSVFYRRWTKDYFTSALPWQQRGVAPAFPVSGITHAHFDIGLFGSPSGAGGIVEVNSAALENKITGGNATGDSNLANIFNSNTVDLSGATTFTVSDLRLSVQIQKFFERNARAGVRYTEFLQEHFGVHPRDERLQRPEYIGGSKQPLIISEVLKTSQDGTNPQGNLAGHGLSAAMSHVARYHASEFGLIMGILSITPKPVYNSQGFDRQWLRRSRLDFYFPEFAHLSEQAIELEEIFATSVEADNRGIFGYQGRFDELRVKRSGTMCNMRDTLNYWHLARNFAGAPSLNSAFMENNGSVPDQTRIFAVPSVPGYIVHFGNIIKANRPLPNTSEPGLMDHF